MSRCCFHSGAATRRGVDSKSTYPQASSWFPSSTIQFSGSVSRRPGRSRGGRLMLALPSRQVFSCRDFLKSASKFRPLVRTVVRVGRTGWLEGRRGLPRTLFPVKRLFAVEFPFRTPGGRSPQVAEARTRLSPISSARQDQLMRVTTARHDEPAHRPGGGQTPGARRPGAIARRPWSLLSPRPAAGCS